MPGAVPRTSTIALTNATLSYGLQTAGKGLEQACKDNEVIYSAINTYDGKLTCKNVADSFDCYEYTISNLFVNQIVIIHYNKKKLKLNRHAFERSSNDSYEWKNAGILGVTAFCEYICPVGTLEGGIPLLSTHPELRRVIGTLFSVKMVILVITLVGCLSICRFFCKVMCPLGAIYGLLNKVSLFHMDVNMKMYTLW